MSGTLLTTKLFAPRTRPELVARPHLVERLNSGLTHKLILISALAGLKIHPNYALGTECLTLTQL